MKLFYFYITLILVNVSADDDEATYTKHVFLTNAAIELAYNKNDLNVGDNSEANGLEHVIEKMVNNTPSFHNEDFYLCFAKINFMIALPDQTDIVFEIPEMPHLGPLQKCGYYQHIMQQEIRNTLTLDIDIPEADEVQDFGSLDLTTLAEQRRGHVKQALKNIFRRVFADDIKDFRSLNLTALAEGRRVTGTSLENIIRRRVSDGSVLSHKHIVSLLRMCRMIALYMSIKFPTSYTKDLLIDFIGRTCKLGDGITEKIYKKIDGLWWQIGRDNGTVQLLEEQLI
ncbi:uncharacterized protein LOC126839856 [Adelges cooleyi]|uniref:uncharacterized protein LOC126839856 n=1 Tax=Adelges cooleyi TaxID=133065 RepID=UPI0021808129|nr:uncharacterized protein LOC126839856 [Adelges cooleyi]